MITLEFVDESRSAEDYRDRISAAMSELLAAYGGKQGPVARLLGIKQSSVSDILNKKRTPGIGTIVTMARALGRSVDALLGLTAASPAVVHVDSSTIDAAVAAAVRREFARRDAGATSESDVVSPPAKGFQKSAVAVRARETSAPPAHRPEAGKKARS